MSSVPDIIASNLRILFCGINPGLMTAKTGHHFARPGNRFWPALFAAGITPRLLHPSEQETLLEFGLGITNIVARPSATAATLTKAEMIEGGKVLTEKVLTFKPKWLAVLGLGTYRAAFNRPKASIGPQIETIGTTQIWLLPNPSGLNAHYTLDDFARMFRELYATAILS